MTYIDEIKKEAIRQSESCLYTSTSYYMWLRRVRYQRAVFVALPIVLGALATFSVLEEFAPDWVTATLSLLAGLFPALATALKFETNVDAISDQAAGFKRLQDHFRQLEKIDSLGDEKEAREKLSNLMNELDQLRSVSLTAPEKFFEEARKKISKGDYDFTVDEQTA